MRVALFHNEDAGDGTSVDEISSLLERHGHHLVQVVDKEWSAELDSRESGRSRGRGRRRRYRDDRGACTRGMRYAARDPPARHRQQHRQKPGLRCSDRGVDCKLGACATATARSRHRVWSVGRARLHRVSRCRPDSRGHRRRKSAPRERRRFVHLEAQDAVRIFRDVLARFEPQRWTITLDGLATTGEFLLVEVLNMPSIGPNLVLSGEASPSDGFFSVVIATEKQRDVLDDVPRASQRGGRASAVADSAPRSPGRDSRLGRRARGRPAFARQALRNGIDDHSTGRAHVSSGDRVLRGRCGGSR